MRDAVDAWGQHGRTACEKRPSATKTLPEEENPLVSLHTANAALSVLPAIRKTAGKPRRIAFTRFAALRFQRRHQIARCAAPVANEAALESDCNLTARICMRFSVAHGAQGW